MRLTRVDSAGLEVVTAADSPAPRLAWHISEKPLLELGSLEGPPETTFGNVRATGRLPDGRLFVGDEQAHAVRVFSENGEYTATFGGEGNGPGELTWFLTVAPYRGDSIWVYDYNTSAVSIFDKQLQFGRRFLNPVPEGNYWVEATLPDGRFLLTSAGVNRFPGRSGLVGDTSLVLLSSPDGSAVDSIGRFQARLLYADERGREVPSFFQPRGRALVAGPSLVWYESALPSITLADSTGQPIRIGRVATPAVPATAELVEQFKRQYLAYLQQNPEAPPERLRSMLEEAHYARQLPAFSPEAIADPAGYVWIARYHFEGQQPHRWAVFDLSGAWRGDIETPTDFMLHQVGPGEIIGVRTGEYDVPYVQVFELRR